MRDTAMWAFWRRLQYGVGFGLFWALVITIVYFVYFHKEPSCFDGVQNGEERGVDCGGSCVRICATDVIEPTIRWAQSFKVRDGQYNAVAYIENKNQVAASPEVTYTFTFYDEQGLITEKSGNTILPPDSVYPIFEGSIQTGQRIPTQTFIELNDSDLWIPATVGRNQFTVVDRKLSSVDEQPRLDAIISNNALTQARDVEIVATIFDAKGNALTSSRTFVEAFPPQSQQTVVFTWPEPIAKTVRSCEIPTDVVLAIDVSGSMNNDGIDPPEPITSVLSAAKAFVSRLEDADQASVVTFATNARTDVSLTSDITTIQNSITNLSIQSEEESGSTNTGEAFLFAAQELQSDQHNQNARKVVVILTDGLATAPDDNPEVYAIEKAESLKAMGVEVYAIGLGEQVNMEFIQEIATSPGFAYQALSSEQVDQIYRTITSALCEDGPAVIDIIPKTNASFAPLQ